MNNLNSLAPSGRIKAAAFLAAVLAGAGIYLFVYPGIWAAGGLKPTPDNPYPARTENEKALLEAITRRDAPALRAVLAKEPALANMEFGTHEFGRPLAVDVARGKSYHLISMTLPLNEATISGNVEMATALLDAGARVDAQGGEAFARIAAMEVPAKPYDLLEDYYSTPAEEAEAKARQREEGKRAMDAIFDLLLSRGADPNAGGGAALKAVAERGSPERLRKLLDAGAVAGIQAAMAAVQKREKDLEYFSPRDARGYPLPQEEAKAALEAERRTARAIFQLLLEHVAKATSNAPGAPSADGQGSSPEGAAAPVRSVALKEPLRNAIAQDDIERVQELLDAGADPNFDGGWPLVVMVRSNNAALLEVLLEAGADPDAMDIDWLEEAAEKAPAEIAVPLIAASRSVQGWGGKALEEIADKGRVEVAKALAAAGANVNFRRGGPLREALRAKDRPMVEALLACGARPGASECLLSAVNSGDPALARLLLDAGADPQAGGNNYPLETAIREKQKDMVVLLMERGADATEFSRSVYWETSDEIWEILRAAGAERGGLTGGPIVVRGGDGPVTVRLKVNPDGSMDRADD